MRYDEWLRFFEDHRGKKLFSIHDLVLLTGDRRDSLAVQLSRMVKSGVIKRPARGWYANPFDPPTAEELAMVIRPPCYLSMEYALSARGILSQSAYTYTLITSRLPYTYKSEAGTFEYNQMKRDLFWGYETRGTVLLAEPEKALLDLIYIRVVRRGELSERGLGSMVDDMYVEELDRERLERYSERFNNATRKVLWGVWP